MRGSEATCGAGYGRTARLNEIEAMNATSRAILQTVLSTDASLSAAERSAAQRLIDGKIEAPGVETGGLNEGLLVTQKRAAELLSVSRATIWRMTKDCYSSPR